MDWTGTELGNNYLMNTYLIIPIRINILIVIPLFFSYSNFNSKGKMPPTTGLKKYLYSGKVPVLPWDTSALLFWSAWPWREFLSWFVFQRISLVPFVLHYWPQGQIFVFLRH